MKYWTVPSLALLLVLVPAAAHGQVKDSPYYPLKVGTKWEYKAGDQKFTMRVAKHEKYGDTMCALVETVADDKVIASEHIAVTDDGVYRYSFNGQKAEPPVRIFKLPPTKGDTWKFETKMGPESVKGTMRMGEDKVKVPAGEYTAFSAGSDDCKVGDRPPFTFMNWYAQGVGMVKQTMKLEGKDVVIELEKFEAGK